MRLAMPPTSLLRIEIREAVGIITLDHPRQRNALSRQLVDEIVAVLGEFGRQRLRVKTTWRMWLAGRAPFV
jgi:enoyl-CoA hydratase/carnithine racemase